MRQSWRRYATSSEWSTETSGWQLWAAYIITTIQLGGRDKKVPFDEMARLLPDRVKVLLLIGEAASQIEAAARRLPNCPPIVRCEGLAEAVAQVHKLARTG